MIALTTLSQRLEQKKGIWGILNSVPHPDIVEMIAIAGYDFVLLDLEHLPHDDARLRHCIQLAQFNGCTPLIRIAAADIPRAGRLLDMGAHGIVLSRAESAGQLRALQDAMFFPPIGTRGITGGGVTGYGSLTLEEYIRQVNGGLWLAPMIESPAGLAAIDEMLTVPQVTLVMEGAVDLSISMGLGPRPTHPLIEEQIRLLASRCSAAGKPFCAYPRTDAQQRYWQRQETRCWLCGEDRGFFFRTLRQRLSDVQDA